MDFGCRQSACQWNVHVMRGILDTDSWLPLTADQTTSSRVTKTLVLKPVELKEQWLVQFGLEVSTRDVGTSKVTSVLRLICKHSGRDEGDANADGGINL
jgi:hypothetical protein